MDTPTTVRISTRGELLGYLPYALGFHPRDSAVLVGLRGERNRLGLVSRVDLADLAHPVGGRRIMREMAWLMARDGAHDVVVVLYRDLPRSVLATDPLVRGALEHLRTLSTWADAPGPLVAGDGTWGSWGYGEECGPAEGDLAGLAHGSLPATMVLSGQNVAAGRENLQVPRSADPVRCRAATAAARAARRRLTRLRSRSGGGAALPGAAFGAPGARPAVDQEEITQWRRDERRRWERLVALAGRGASLPAAELGRLAAALEDNLVRDGVLCSLVRPLPPGPPDATAVHATLDLALLPGGPPPDPERLEPATTVLRALAATAPRHPAALALALLAWAAWWEADGARADVLARQALSERPRARLAQLVVQTLEARVPPGWVQDTVREDSAARRTTIR